MSADRPLCRTCAKLIPQSTETHYFGRTIINGPTDHAEQPANKYEAARIIGNGKVVSVRFWRHRLASVGVWQGEYIDDHFCSPKCAATFGRAMAETFPLYAMPAYHAAVATRKEKARA